MKSMSRASPKHLALLLLPLLLSACQAPGGFSPATATGRAAPSRNGEPDPPAAAGPGGLPSVAELAADPLRFTGMSAADVTGLLGTPSFQRRDASAEIWQYYGPSSACVLDLFVYPEQGVQRVAHAELRSRTAGRAAASACLAQILDGKRG
jgi:hypothetical protein